MGPINGALREVREIMSEDQLELLKEIPQVQKLLESDAAHALLDNFSRQGVLRAMRLRLEETRRELLAGNGARFCQDIFFKDVEALLQAATRKSLRPVINATGIVIHTNLGRTPLAAPKRLRRLPKSRVVIRTSNSNSRPVRAVRGTRMSRTFSAD